MYINSMGDTLRYSTAAQNLSGDGWVGSAANLQYDTRPEGPARSVTGGESMTADAVFIAQETHKRPTSQPVLSSCSL